MLSHQELDLSLTNVLNQNAYEAHSDGYSSDEAANLVEQASSAGGPKNIKNESNFMLRPANSQSDIYVQLI